MILTAHPALLDDPNPRFYSKLRGLKAIGYWKVYPWKDPSGNVIMDGFHQKQVEKYASLPDPKDYIDNAWREDHRRLVATYLKTQPAIESWRGSSSCRLCGIHNGSQCLGDDVFIWPQGFAHYVEAHSVRPPEEFINHVMMRLAGSMVRPRAVEPMPTEEDLRRMREMEARMEDERREAIAAGERLPPISVDLWPNKD